MQIQSPTDRSQAWARILAVAAVVGLVCGCASDTSAVPKGAFPSPLVVPLPVRVGLVLDDALSKYAHDEDIQNLGHWHVEVGPQQREMFRTVVAGMFTHVTEYPSAEAAQNEDGVIVPEVVDFQMSIPARSRSDFFEVWIKYKIRLYDHDGTLVVEWPLTAYGKSSQEDYGMLQRKSRPGMEDATMTALRDAGAFLSLRFADVPTVKTWLAAHGAIPPAATPATADAGATPPTTNAPTTGTDTTITTPPGSTP